MDKFTLEKLITSKINELGYELYSLKEKREKSGQVFDIVVDRREPISLNDIVSLTNSLNEYIDEHDDSISPYTLDISSLGAEKPLSVDKLHLYVGEYVHLHVINPIEGINIFEGTLESVNNDSLVLSYRVKTREKRVNVMFSNINNVRLAIKF